MRVIGSQDISTRLPRVCVRRSLVAVNVSIFTSSFLCLGASHSPAAAMGSITLEMAIAVVFWMIAGGELWLRVAPFWFLVDARVCDRAQRADELAVLYNQRAGKCSSRRLVHERHEFVRKAGHGTCDANAADIRTATDPVHPTALGHVAIHYRSPTADLHQTFGRAVLVREIALLVIRPAVAALVNGLAEQPGGPQIFIQRNHGRETRHLIEQIQQRLHHIVRLHRATRDVYYGQTKL